MVDMDVLKTARQIVEDQCFSDDTHTIYIGEVNKSDNFGIVVEVTRKLTADQLEARNTIPVPTNVVVNGELIFTDVVQAPMSTDRRLRLDGPGEMQQMLAQASNRHQGCFDCPIPGGAQIAPAGANWVGTLSGALMFPDENGNTIYGAFTNNHVAIKSGARKGDQMLQPGGRSDWFAQLHSWKVIAFGRNDRNLIDCALLNCHRTDGKYAPGTDTVAPSQVELGAYVPNPELNPTIGMQVVKSGRTTGVTKGKVIGLNSTSRVGYGNGTATFVDQIVLQGNDRRDMSAPGDSGSLILTADMRPLCLLFAGGGGTTIANPIKYVLEWSKGKFYGQR